MAAASVGTEVGAAEGTAEAAALDPGTVVLAGGAAVSEFAGATDVADGAPADAVAAIEPCQFHLSNLFPSRFQILFQLTCTHSLSCGYSRISVPTGVRAVLSLASLTRTVMNGAEEIGLGAKARHATLISTSTLRKSITRRVVAVLLYQTVSQASDTEEQKVMTVALSCLYMEIASLEC